MSGVARIAVGGALVGAVLALIACGGPGIAIAPDAVSAGPDGGGGVGLAIPWTVTPAVPGAVATGVTITSMTFHVESLRVVGDAGTSVSIGDLALTWGAGQAPAPTWFADAPSGLYSKVVFHADGEVIDYSWQIDGSVELDDGTHAFSFHDRAALTASIDTSATLSPGGTAMLGVHFGIDQPFDGLDFKSLDNAGGTLQLDTADSQMEGFRARLQKAISADHSGQQVE